MTEPYPWVRREGESPQAYAAFREYLNMGDKRSLQGVSDALPKALSLLKRWSLAHDWAARSLAYDRHVATADTDGLVSQVAERMDKSLALMDKLRGLLDSRLDQFIQRKEDPTIRWTQAVVAMSKIEANSLVRRDDTRTDERIGRIEELVERAMSEGERTE